LGLHGVWTSLFVRQQQMKFFCNLAQVETPGEYFYEQKFIQMTFLKKKALLSP